MIGQFITFEGIEGSGKSTQIILLQDFLQQKKYKTILTREPGGTAIGESIREILLNPDFKEMSPMTELLLYAAARSQHVTQVIHPALQAGKIVLSDRYADATTAYQGTARAIDKKLLQQVHALATQNLQPHLTIVLDCPPKKGLERVQKRERDPAGHVHLDRLEKENFHFHQKVREGYLAIAEAEPKRVKVINATESIEEVQERIREEVIKKIKNNVE